MSRKIDRLVFRAERVQYDRQGDALLIVVKIVMTSLESSCFNMYAESLNCHAQFDSESLATASDLKCKSRFIPNNMCCSVTYNSKNQVYILGGRLNQ